MKPFPLNGMVPLPLNQESGMPQMGPAFSGWTMQICLVRVRQEIVDGLVESTTKNIYFQGTIQPLSPNKIMLKPEGQRSWEWLQIHCFSGSLDLETNDRIIYNGVPFKIMATNDYQLNNYIEYHLVRDYEQPC